jgi:branched-chain amino acid transport system permease protein
MLARLLRVGIAAVVAFFLAWPFASLRGDESRGFAVSWVPAVVVAGVVLVAGVLFALLVEGLAAAGRGGLRVPVPDPVHRWGPWALAAVVAALPLLGLSGSWSKLLLETMVFATIAVGLQITIGMAGLLVLGHAGFWAVGAYTYGTLVIHAGWNFWPAWAAAGLAAGAVGLVVGLPALRLRGDYLAVVTLGFGEAIRWVIKNEDHLTGGDANLPSNLVPGDLRARNGWFAEWLWQPGGAGRDIDHECYWLALVLLAVCCLCVSLLTRSRHGRALFALREDETAARCMGIDTTRTKLLAFVASATWAGLAGVVTATHRGSVNPEMFDFNTSVLFVAMVVLGGLGSIPGAVLGAALLWMIPALLQDRLPQIQQYRMLVLGAVMAAMMVVRPEGLLGGFTAARRKAGSA